MGTPVRQRPLTPEQRDFAAKNHNLIYCFARAFGVDLEEYYGVLAIALCIAARNYKPESGYKFSTFAFKIMRREYSNTLIYERAQKHIPQDKLLSYDEPLGEDTDSITLLDTLSDDRVSSCAFDPTQAEVSEFIKTVPSRYTGVLASLIDGEYTTDIAARSGCTKQNIYEIRIRLRKYWESYYA